MEYLKGPQLAASVFSILTKALRSDSALFPDVEVWPTIVGIRDGRDEVLEEALRASGFDFNRSRVPRGVSL